MHKGEWPLSTLYTTKPMSVSLTHTYLKSQPHKGHLTSKLKYRRFPSYLMGTKFGSQTIYLVWGYIYICIYICSYVWTYYIYIYSVSQISCETNYPSYLLCTSLLFTFHLLPSPVNPIGFPFCFFPGSLAIFTLLSSNNKLLGKHREISIFSSPTKFWL